MPRVLCFGDVEISWHGAWVSTCPFYHLPSHIKGHTLVMLLRMGSKDMTRAVVHEVPMLLHALVALQRGWAGASGHLCGCRGGTR